MNRTLHTALSRTLGALCLVALAGACSDADLAKVDPAQLVVEPTEVTFPLPADGERTADVTVDVRNTGGSTLFLDAAVLTEDDDSEEVSIVDGDDWTGGGLQVAPGSSVPLTLRWTVLNAQIDTGTVALSSNGGSATVSFTTLDIDPRISVTTTPAGTSSDQGTSVSLADALPGGYERVVVTATSGSVAALEIESICLVDPQGTCLTNDTSAPFRLCRGEPASPAACDPVEAPDALAQGATHTFTAFFEPDAGAVDTSVGTALIRSNAANSPTYSVELSGTPCIRRADGDVCGTCGNGETDVGEDCDDGNVDDNDDCRTDCTEALCGDGLLRDGAEACDDGNRDDDDACRNDCTEAECGDGVVWTGMELCDDGNDVDTDACRADCSPAECGDGVVWEGREDCDDGNDVETDGCRNDCTEAFCGDGVVQEGVEECDDGNVDDTDGCLTSCIIATCGDGLVQEGVEECDDNNRDNNDACLNDCRVAECGDGVVRTDFEACDDGNRDNTDACLNTCEEAFCGDGVVQADVEECDDGDLDNTDACLTNCRDATCGDGVVQEGVEDCDDENRVNEDACLNNCRAAECGDGVVREGFEDCDDGNRTEEDACRNNCEEAFCGDGVVWEGEEDCDDGNRTNTDACLNSCAIAECGDGVVQTDVDECDDGNDNDNDACRNNCQDAECGDGVVWEDEEECDDANDNDRDACRNNCEDAECGDGVVWENEEGCDDGNDNDNDACLNTCVPAECGDGVVQTDVDECDDGNDNDNDACRNNCRDAFCGDGVVWEDEEECDDANDVETDACVPGCLDAFCGDGIVQENVEDCDDGNNRPGDACNPNCSDNGAPTAPTVRVDPADPIGGDPLFCTVVADGVDPDGDDVSYTYQWFVDNAPSGVNQASLPGGRTAAGEVWRCAATPTDGLLQGPAGQDQRTIRLCRGDAVVCRDGNVQTCNQQGDGYTLLENCNGNGCEDGACLGGGPCGIKWDRNQAGPGIVFSENDYRVMSSVSWQAVRAPLGHSTGKWYFEIEAQVGPNGFNFAGVGRVGSVLDGCCTGGQDSWGYYGSAGNLRGLNSNHNPNGAQWRGGTYTIGIAVDLDNDRIWWALDGVWQASGNPATGANPTFSNVSGTVYPQTSVALANSFSTLHACRDSLRFTPPPGFAVWGPN